MNQSLNEIKCPNCGTEIAVDQVLTSQIHADLQQKLAAERADMKAKHADEQQKLAAQRTAMVAMEEKNSKAESDLAAQRIAMEKDKANFQQELNTAVQQKLAAEVAKTVREKEQDLKKSIREEIQAEQAGKITVLQEALDEKTEQVKKLNTAEAEVVKLKGDMATQRGKIELEQQQKFAQERQDFAQQLKDQEMRIKKDAEKDNELKIKEKEKTIADLREGIIAAEKKADLAPGYLKGEALEIAIEKWLKAQFPLDTIEETGKFKPGADCLQTVNTRSRANCGVIYYESKRTKAFANEWIGKLKKDIQDKKANIGVLVTEAMPKDMERMGLKDGIWICTFDEFKGLCVVLRESIIRESAAIATQENKGDKMNLLYDFLISDEFCMQVQAIVDGFTEMKEDLNKEKRQIQTNWKKREKQIDKVLLNTGNMYGAIKGIAGNAVQSVPQLEFNPDEKFE